jgi:hypothetical protein
MAASIMTPPGNLKRESPVMRIEHFCPDIPKADPLELRENHDVQWSLTLHAGIALKAFATGSATNSEAGKRA